MATAHSSNKELYMTYLIYAGLIIFGTFFTGAAAMKLSRHQHMVEEFESMQTPYILARISGAIEILCGPALIVGIWIPATAGIAAAVMFCVMVGASLTNLFATGRGLGPALGVLFVFALPMLLLALHYLETTRAVLGV
jgi:uncharacterized membrane protein YphA (DoxX/SURF4 family)